MQVPYSVRRFDISSLWSRVVGSGVASSEWALAFVFNAGVEWQLLGRETRRALVLQDVLLLPCERMLQNDILTDGMVDAGLHSLEGAVLRWRRIGAGLPAKKPSILLISSNLVL